MIWLSSKYLKTKRNRKLKAKFFGLFQVLYPVGKQAYKLKLLKKCKVYNIFYILLLKQNITKKRQVNDMQLQFEAGNDKKYKFDGIQNSVVYAKVSITSRLSELYYLVL